jgi:hypothetical protein
MQNNDQLSRGAQGGATLIETTFGLLAVLFFAGLCLELMQAHQTRHLISLALQEAARVAAVTRANPEHWRPVLIRGLRPTYASTAAQQQHARLTQLHGLAPYFVEALPHARARQTQGHGALLTPSHPGQPTDAVLHLRLTYFYVPKQPWLRAAIKMMGELSAVPHGAHTRLLKMARTSGLIPIVVEYKVLMHSDLPG